MPAEARARRPWRIGLTAHLDGGGSAHTGTFERALQRALVQRASVQRASAQRTPTPSPAREPLAELHVACDGASAERAEAVARRFVDAQVDVVVGHFASAAAAAAAPRYEDAGIPLLLPAATAPPLTAHANVFRLCPHDGALQAAVTDWLARPRSWTDLCVLDDGSASARGFADALRAAARRIAGVCTVASAADAQALFFAGRHHAALELVRALGDRLPAHLMLSDDAIHPAMSAELAARGRSAIAFGLDVAEPGVGIYFAETCAAVEIALALQCCVTQGLPPIEAVQNLAWPTTLGVVSFDRGENVAARVACWRLGPAGAEVLAPDGGSRDASEFDRKARSVLRSNHA